MPLIDYTLTLTAAAIQGSKAYPAATGAHGVALAVDGQIQGGFYDVPLRTCLLQPDGANAGVVYVGGSNLVSSTLYGFRLEVPVSSIPPPPFLLGEFPSGPFKLSDLWFFGTANDKVHIFLVEF